MGNAFDLCLIRMGGGGLGLSAHLFDAAQCQQCFSFARILVRASLYSIHPVDDCGLRIIFYVCAAGVFRCAFATHSADGRCDANVGGIVRAGVCFFTDHLGLSTRRWCDLGGVFMAAYC